jgi:hypothetical protein
MIFSKIIFVDFIFLILSWLKIKIIVLLKKTLWIDIVSLHRSFFFSFIFFMIFVFLYIFFQNYLCCFYSFNIKLENLALYFFFFKTP